MFSPLTLTVGYSYKASCAGPG